MIALTAAAVLYFTEGFGSWTRPGPIIKPVSATVFSPTVPPTIRSWPSLAIEREPKHGVVHRYL